MDELLLQTAFLDGLHPVHGKSLLMEAARRGEEEVARRLLEHGADVDLRRVDGMTALHDACVKGYYAIARLLLKWKADPEVESISPKSLNALDFVIKFAPERSVADLRLLLLESGMKETPNLRGEWSRRCVADASKLAWRFERGVCGQPLPT